nr:xylulose kinase-1 [Tanacetum cinerariifolium]
MARLAFCDYHNMIAILEKSEHNIDFHQIVDFVEASHIKYALTINPTVYVSHIRQFWSTARIETTNEGTKILATVDGKPRTISESSIRRNVKLNDEEGISTLPDADPKTTGFNEFSRNIATAVGEGSGTPTKPHHTPSPEAQQSPYHDLSSSLHPTEATETIPTETPTEIPTLRDDSHREAFSTVYGLEARHDRENIIKTSALPHDSIPRVTSLDANKGSMQQQLQELTDLYTRLIKLPEDKDKGTAELSKDDAPIKRRSLETWEEAYAANILTSGVQAISVPPIAEVSTVGVPTGSGLVPTVSAIFTTASVVTPYSRRPREISAKDKGKEKMVESNTPKKKKLQEQIDSEAELTIGEKIDLINELVKYQDHHAKILKYQAQQSKPLSKKEQREFYMSVLRSHSGWKTKHFREEGERVKRKGLKLEQGSAKRMKTSREVSEEDLKEMMQLVPVEEIYMEALQLDREDLNQLWTLVKETLSIRQALSNKEKELWVKLKRLFEPDVEDQLDQGIFMLVERDYPLRKGLAIVMICNKLQLENYSQMANDLIMKIHNIAKSPR